MIKILAFSTFIFSSFFISAQNVISIDSITAHIGKTVKICDKVAGTFVTKGDKPVTYLNLGADYPKTKLTIVIFQKNLINFPFIPSDHFKDKAVCITGEVTQYKERLQIVANSPEQIEIN